MTQEANRPGWAARIFVSNAREVIGPVRGSPRLHWTQQAAQEEAEAWATEMGLGQINWESADEETVIGRTPRHTVVLTSILLPVGSPDGDIQ
jgi:hypothetical protein